MPLGAARIALLAKTQVVAAAEVIRKKVGVSAIGNAQIDTAQSYFGGASLFLDTTSDYLTAGDGSETEFQFGSSDFTIEAWIRPDTTLPTSGTPIQPIFNKYNTSNNRMVSFGIVDTYLGYFWASSGNSGNVVQSTQVISLNTWQHIALVRSGTTWTMYYNGTSVDSRTLDVTLFNSTDKIYIGSYFGSGGNNHFLGNIDELRVSNTARYTTGFTPSTTPFTNDDDTLLLLHMDGTDGSTHFEDDNGVGRSAVGLKQNGNTQIDTAQYKFGGTSALFDGASDGIIAPDFPAIGTGEFTAEAWIRFTDSDGGTIFDFDEGFGSGPLLYLRSDEKIDLFYNGGGINFGSTVLSPNTWYHIALTRESDGYTRIYIDGTLDSTSSSTFTTSIGSGIRIGIYSTIYFAGHMDEIRISDTARYTAAFTAPTAPFVNDSNTLLLMHMDGTDGSTLFLDDNGTQGRGNAVVVTAEGDAQIDTAQSQFGGASLLLDGTGDRLSYQRYNPIGTGDFTFEAWVYRTGGNTPTVFADYISFYVNNSDYIGFFSGGHKVGTETVSSNAWHHLVWARESGTIRMWVDGVYAGGYANTTNFVDTTLRYIGGYNDIYNWEGSIDEVRVSNIARYTGTSNFTAPTEPFQNDANTLLLLHMNGADGSTTFLDDCGRQKVGVSAIGNAQIDTAQYQFGGASALFDGTGDYLQLGDSELGNYIGDGDYTFECWARTSDITTNAQVIASCRKSSFGLFGWQIAFRGDLTGDPLQLYFASTNTTRQITGLSSNTWYHIALVNNNGTISFYVNGTIVNTGFSLGTYNDGEELLLGIQSSISSGHNGHIDEVRISDTARYTANFTAPTAPFQNDANTLLLLHMDGTDGDTDFVDDNGKESA